MYMLSWSNCSNLSCTHVVPVPTQCLKHPTSLFSPSTSSHTRMLGAHLCRPKKSDCTAHALSTGHDSVNSTPPVHFSCCCWASIPEESPTALIASELGLAAALSRCRVAPLKASGRLGKKRKFLLQQLYTRPDRTCKDERLLCSGTTTATLLLLLLWCCALNAAAGANGMNREWWKRDVCCGLTVMAMADPATVVMVVTLQIGRAHV